jgi:hypothetical protein
MSFPEHPRQVDVSENESIASRILKLGTKCTDAILKNGTLCMCMGGLWILKLDLTSFQIIKLPRHR